MIIDDEFGLEINTLHPGSTTIPPGTNIQHMRAAAAATGTATNSK
jgi:hypothetical protein